MKQSLRIFSFLLTASLILASCEEPSSTASSDPSFGGKPGGGGSTPADPALTYVGFAPVKNKLYKTLFVMDVDGSHLTPIYRRTTLNYDIGGSPTWSPDGESIAFTQYGDGVYQPDTIKAIDVSVNSSGDVVASNLRTIIGLSTVSVRIKNPFWSATTGTNTIAYTTDDGTTNSLWRVSGSGGSATLITTISKAWAGHTNPLGSPTWNGDDSKLAMIRIGANNTTIMIYNTSDWSYIDSITVDGVGSGLEWSRAGSVNSLAYSSYYNGAGKIYYVAPTTGASPTTNGVSGTFPAWSPDNSTHMVTAGTNLFKYTSFSASWSLVTTIPNGAPVKWK